MPISNDQYDLNEELYEQSKQLRSSATKKQLRHLRAFERINYKKTCEITKTGHNLNPEHRLDDGNMRYGVRNLTYSMNKKKRWLLPGIIEQRICEHDLSDAASQPQKKDGDLDIDERLKIVMYENENVRYTSNCLRYGNSQTKPHILHKNGRRFNSMTLTKWMEFNTGSRWNRRGGRGRRENDDRVNQPNFGVEQRPGFFPAEVTYEFLYPRSVPESEGKRGGRTSLRYQKSPNDGDWFGRHFKDTNRNRRFSGRIECNRLEKSDPEFNVEEMRDEHELATDAFQWLDENERWTVVFEEADEEPVSTGEFSIDCFIPSIFSDNSPAIPSDEVYDCKAHKYYEPPPEAPSSSAESDAKRSAMINESVLCSLPCKDESEFLSSMQLPSKHLSQANLSPAIFLQRSATSSFSVVYSYCRTSSTVTATLKFTGLPPNILIRENRETPATLIDLVSTKIDEYESVSNGKPAVKTRLDVDALRGSLPLPLTVTNNMLLVRPHATDKQTALRMEQLVDNGERGDNGEQWFDTIDGDYEMLECSICCEALTTQDAFQLLPCRHTLCHDCLKSFVRTSIATATYSSSSTAPLTCFQSNCSTQLNPSLLQAFVSYEIYQAYNQSMVDRHLFSSGHYRQCPSRSCSNLLIVDDPAKSSLMCSCGQRVCARCLEEYHFPATCDQYKSYVSRLRESGDDLLSTSKVGDNTHCYIAEGKNCPTCGEFVEKNGGCPHMTCKCGNEYCWTCLRRWASHNYATCFGVPESIHELRSSTKNRLHNKAINHRRQRNQFAFDSLSSAVRQSKLCAGHHDVLVSTYIDLNTMAEFIYVLLQRRRTDVNIRAVLAQTARRLESEAFRLKVQVECEQIKVNDLENIRAKLRQTLASLLHMKRNHILA